MDEDELNWIGIGRSNAGIIMKLVMIAWLVGENAQGLINYVLFTLLQPRGQNWEMT